MDGKGCCAYRAPLSIFNEEKTSRKKSKSIQIFVCTVGVAVCLSLRPPLSFPCFPLHLHVSFSSCTLPFVLVRFLIVLDVPRIPLLARARALVRASCLRAPVVQHGRDARRGVAPVPHAVPARRRQADHRVARVVHVVRKRAARAEDVAARLGVCERPHVGPGRVNAHLRAVSGGGADTRKQFSGATSANASHLSKRHSGIFLNAAVQSAESSRACLEWRRMFRCACCTVK